MADQVGKRCATCKFAKNLTCWHNLPHECQPWNRCDFWEPKEVEQ